MRLGIRHREEILNWELNTDSDMRFSKAKISPCFFDEVLTFSKIYDKSITMHNVEC